MKKILFTLTLSAALALCSQPAFAQKKAAPAPDATKPADAPKAADPAKPKGDKPKADKAAADKPLPMNARADEIDAAGKSFTQNTKDGKKVKNVVTDKTEIKNGDKDAKFEDIKVGDTVAGSRIKKSDTEYEVVKITKFGAPAKKPDAKPDAKPEGKPATKPEPKPKADAPKGDAPKGDAPKGDAPKGDAPKPTTK